jgi:hypothetical protein
MDLAVFGCKVFLSYWSFSAKTIGHKLLQPRDVTGGRFAGVLSSTGLTGFARLGPLASVLHGWLGMQMMHGRVWRMVNNARQALLVAHSCHAENA